MAVFFMYIHVPNTRAWRLILFYSCVFYTIPREVQGREVVNVRWRACASAINFANGDCEDIQKIDTVLINRMRTATSRKMRQNRLNADSF